jgi:hypothetical protein
LSFDIFLSCFGSSSQVAVINTKFVGLSLAGDAGSEFYSLSWTLFYELSDIFNAAQFNLST